MTLHYYDEYTLREHEGKITETETMKYEKRRRNMK